MRFFADIVALTADAYRSAALASADMRAATDALEDIRAEFLKSSNSFSVWDRIDNRIGRAEADRLRPVLMQFRERFERMLKEKETARIAELFLQDENLAWTEW